MAYYTLEEKTTFWLSLQKNKMPNDIINVIWENVLEQKRLDVLNTPPPTPQKKGIRKRTLKMMDRWRLNGQWERHVRNIQFEDMDPKFITYN
jgi:hypothetical protein